MSYSPTLGRFLERDPAKYIDGPDEYQFEKSNPVNLVDPSGLNSIPPSAEQVLKDLQQRLAYDMSMHDGPTATSAYLLQQIENIEELIAFEKLLQQQNAMNGNNVCKAGEVPNGPQLTAPLPPPPSPSAGQIILEINDAIWEGIFAVAGSVFLGGNGPRKPAPTITPPPGYDLPAPIEFPDPSSPRD